MEDGVFYEVLKWAWISFVGFLVHIYRTFTVHETRLKVLEIVNEHQEKLRLEDRKLRIEDRDMASQQRRELLKLIESHNVAVLARMDKIETLVKSS